MLWAELLLLLLLLRTSLLVRLLQLPRAWRTLLLYLTISVYPLPLLLPSIIPRETARTTTLAAAAPPPAALPKATDSERVGIALGRRGGNVRLHYLLYLAIGICIANKVLYSHSRVFSWVCVDDRFLYDVLIRKLSDDLWTICSSVFVIPTLRIMFTSLSTRVKTF